MSLTQEVNQPDPLRQEITDHELTATQTSDTNDMTQQIHQSKTARNTAKASLTRKMSEIIELITDIIFNEFRAHTLNLKRSHAK